MLLLGVHRRGGRERASDRIERRVGRRVKPSFSSYFPRRARDGRERVPADRLVLRDGRVDGWGDMNRRHGPLDRRGEDVEPERVERRGARAALLRRRRFFLLHGEEVVHLLPGGQGRVRLFDSLEVAHERLLRLRLGRHAPLVRGHEERVGPPLLVVCLFPLCGSPLRDAPARARHPMLGAPRAEPLVRGCRIQIHALGVKHPVAPVAEEAVVVVNAADFARAVGQ